MHNDIHKLVYHSVKLDNISIDESKADKLKLYVNNIKHILVDMIYMPHIQYFIEALIKIKLIEYNTMVYFIKKLMNTNVFDKNTKISFDTTRSLIQHY